MHGDGAAVADAVARESRAMYCTGSSGANLSLGSSGLCMAAAADDGEIGRACAVCTAWGVVVVVLDGKLGEYVIWWLEIVSEGL